MGYFAGFSQAGDMEPVPELRAFCCFVGIRLRTTSRGMRWELNEKALGLRNCGYFSIPFCNIQLSGLYIY